MLRSVLWETNSKSGYNWKTNNKSDSKSGTLQVAQKKARLLLTRKAFLNITSGKSTSGKYNIFEYFYRLCRGPAYSGWSIAEKANKYFMNLTVRIAKARAFTLEEIVEVTMSDEELTQQKNALLIEHFFSNEQASRRFDQ